MKFSNPKYPFLIGLGYIIFLFLLLGSTGFFSESDFNFGTNKTIGDVYDFVLGDAVFFLGSQLIAVTGYGFLWLFKCRINAKISILHYFVIVLMPLVVNFEDRTGYYGLTIGISVFIVILAVLNVLFALYYKLYDKNKRLEH